MSDNGEPTQQPTPSKTPKRPQVPQRMDSDQSVEDPGYGSRSRSQSRRRRRQNQRQRAQQQQQQQQQDGGGKGAQAQSMAKIEEEQAGAEAQAEPENTMQMFERIGMIAVPLPILNAANWHFATPPSSQVFIFNPLRLTRNAQTTSH
jgi:hypothetical protein